MKFRFVLIFLVFSVLASGQNYSVGFNVSKNFLSLLEAGVDYYGSSYFSEDNSNNSSYSIKFSSINNKTTLSAGITYNVENFDFIYHHDSYTYSNGSSHSSDSYTNIYFYKSRQSEINLNGGLQIPLLSNSVKTSQFMVDLGVLLNLYRKNQEIQDSSINTRIYTQYSQFSGSSSTTTTVWSGNSDDIFSIYENPLLLYVGLSFSHCFRNNLLLQFSTHYRPLNYIAKMDDIVIKSYLTVGAELQYKFPCRKTNTSDN